ncbi:MAG: SpoIIE family protein phosphatase [Acidobacteriaceae bacterium]|nr:SpoIIE family protein phosphatase [Acidobacteriaceae bacterium]MBV9779068.1 SpoIIE family protein phosphatase [Acidobacteriaceae bacterium]
MPTTRKEPPVSADQPKVRFRHRAELLDFLLEVSAITAETLDLDRVLANVAEIVKDVIPYDLFAILLYNERAGGLSVRYSIGHRDEISKNVVLPLGEGITGTAAAIRQPILVPDVRADSRYLNALDAVRAELAVPMLVRGKLVGVIDLESTQVNAFSQQHRALLALIASRIGVAIDNARLYRRVERQNRTLRLLAHVSQEFSSILELDELLTKIAIRLRALVEFDAFSIYLVDDGNNLLRCRFSQRYDNEKAAEENVQMGKGVTGAAAERREVINVPDVTQDPRYIPTHFDTRSEVAVPLVLHDRVIGVVDLESARLGFFTEEHVRMLTLLAPQIATSVENARLYEELALREQRMEADLQAAYKLQSVLLPRAISDIPGLEVAIRRRPAREISGDLYDFFEHSDEYTLIAFGDVSGKGAAAALFGALISGLLRTLAPRRRSPSHLMKLLNEALLERKVDAQYATLALLLWDSRNCSLTITNAGALPPLLFRKGEIVEPRAEGVPIGLLENQEYDQVKIAVERDDLMLLYSDGVEDQLREDEEEYGRERLKKLLESVGGRNPQRIVNSIFEDLDAFRGATPLTDDQTVIALRVV